MQAGKLDRQITIQTKTETIAASGGVTMLWEDVATLRAEVREQTADEIATGFGFTEAETLVFVIRWHPSRVTTDQRIMFDGRAYDIKQIAEIGRRAGLKLRGVAS
jgi:SPP1 family predicted phage head-tail adaptor